MSDSQFVRKAYIVPGQPHIYLAGDRNAGWASLRQAYESVGREIANSGAELLLVYSTQWFSVIGHLMQVVHANPRYDLALLAPYVLGQRAQTIHAGPERGTNGDTPGAGAQPSLVSPVAFWAVLGLAVVVLLGLVVRMVRAA